MRLGRTLPLMAVGLMGVASCGADDNTAVLPPATTAEPTPTTTERPTVTWVEPTVAEGSGAGGARPASFSTDRDDLCEWVTGDKVAGFVLAAGFDVAGPAMASEPETEDRTGWDCAWTFASGEELQLGIRPRPGRLDSLQELDEIVEYAEPGQVMNIGAVVSGHPVLGDGVVVENTAFGRFVFFTPERDDVLNVWFGGTGDDESGVMFVAERVLQDLGWVEDCGCET